MSPNHAARALIARVRKLEESLHEACNHLEMAAKAGKEEGLLYSIEATEEWRWVRRQREILVRGASLP